MQRWCVASKLLLAITASAIAWDAATSNEVFGYVFNSKNHAGFAIGLSALALTSIPTNQARPLAYQVLVLVTGIWSCLQINAQAGLVLVALAGTFSAVSTRLFQSRYRLLIAYILATLAPLGVLAFVNSSVASSFASLLGRDLSLSGRTALWSASVDAWTMRPTLGYGFGSVWSDSSQFPAAAIVRAARANGFVDPTSSVVYSHNGFIDTLLETGVVGLVLLLALMWTLGRNSFVLAASPKGHRSDLTPADAATAFGALILIVVANLTESRTFNDAAILILLSLAVSCRSESKSSRTATQKVRLDDDRQPTPSTTSRAHG